MLNDPIQCAQTVGCIGLRSHVVLHFRQSRGSVIYLSARKTPDTPILYMMAILVSIPETGIPGLRKKKNNGCA